MFFFYLAETSFKYAIANCASESILEHINKDVTKSLFEHEMSSNFVDRSFRLYPFCLYSSLRREVRRRGCF